MMTNPCKTERLLPDGVTRIRPADKPMPQNGKGLIITLNASADGKHRLRSRYLNLNSELLLQKGTLSFIDHAHPV